MGFPSMRQGIECNFIKEPWFVNALRSSGRGAAEAEPPDGSWAVSERLAQPALTRRREAERKNDAKPAVAGAFSAKGGMYSAHLQESCWLHGLKRAGPEAFEPAVEKRWVE